MAGMTEASRVIGIVATETLGHVGLRRQGRSRRWLDDKAWWLGIIEFQPSSDLGTYLNVGVMWLWAELPHHAYHVGHRIHQWEPYESPGQFNEVVLMLAREAAAEVSRYRTTFANIHTCADYYASLRDAAPYDFVHAGVALGLVGRVQEARARFDAYLAVEDDRAWKLEEDRRVRDLRGLLEDQAEFRSRIRASIAVTRDLLHLPPLADWPF
jgi:hypothetical protein